MATMPRENPLWGTECLRSELLKLGIVVSNRSIRRYRGRAGPPTEPPRAQVRNQSSAADLGGRPVHRADIDVPEPRRSRVACPRPASAGPCLGDSPRDCRLDAAAGHPGHPLGYPAEVPHPRSRPRLWAGVRRTSTGTRGPDPADADPGPARQCHCRAGRRDTAARVPGPPNRSQRAASARYPARVRRLRQCRPASSSSRTGATRTSTPCPNWPGRLPPDARRAAPGV